LESLSIDTEPLTGSSLLSIAFNTENTAILILIIFVFILLLMLSAMASGSEIALFSLKEKDKAKLSESSSYLDRLILLLLKRPKKLIATILIFNTLVNIMAIILYAITINKYVAFEQNPVITFLVEAVLITLIIVIFGEVLPKIYANQNNFKFARFVAAPITFLVKLFSPFSYLMVKGTKLFESRIKHKDISLSSEDLKQAIDITSPKNPNADDKNILKRIVSFRNVYVKQIMTSRPDVVAFEADIPFHELIREINNNRFSRVPVYKENLDQIIGILYIKDVVAHLEKENTFNWTKLLRKPYYIPESKKIDDLLREFQSKKVHMAVVVDEYGGFSGIITLEDVLEEIVGEITDEFDEPEEKMFRQLDENTFIFNAKISLNEFIKHLNLPDDKFETYLADVETLGGLMIELLGKIPQKDEKTSFQELDFIIESAEKKKVKEVRVVINRDMGQEK